MGGVFLLHWVNNFILLLKIVEINQPFLQTDILNVKVVTPVESGLLGKNELWFELPIAFKDHISLNADAQLVGLLLPAMDMGEDIDINAPISQMLLSNLQDIQSLLIGLMPSLKRIQIRATTVYCDSKTDSGIAVTGFSGGVDSYSVILELEKRENNPLGLMVFNNVGSHGRGSDSQKVFQDRYNFLLPAAEKIGKKFIKIDSNLTAFYRRKLYFHKSYSLRNVSALLLLQGYIHQYFYASAFHESDQRITDQYGIGMVDNLLLPLVKTEQFEVIPFGSNLTRVEKTQAVSQYDKSWEFLHVCVKPHAVSDYPNCSACLKCLRTEMTLDLLGTLTHYKTVFDIKRYLRYKWVYRIYLMSTHYHLDQEVMDLFKEKQPYPSFIMKFFRLKGIHQIANRFSRKMIKLMRNWGV